MKIYQIDSSARKEGSTSRALKRYSSAFAQSLSWMATFAVLYSTDDPHPTTSIKNENKIKNNLLLKNIYPSIFIKIILLKLYTPIGSIKNLELNVSWIFFFLVLNLKHLVWSLYQIPEHKMKLMQSH